MRIPITFALVVSTAERDVLAGNGRNQLIGSVTDYAAPRCSADSLAKRSVILMENGNAAIKRVPCPGKLLTISFPPMRSARFRMLFRPAPWLAPGLGSPHNP